MYSNSVVTNLFLLLYLCHCHVWRVTIQQLGPNYLHVAEVNFFYKNKRLDGSKFEFTSTSYVNTISIGGHSGPPEAANDGNINTFYHSGFQSAVGGNTGICCPDHNPALFITNIDNITFERIRIINRQDLDGDNRHFFNRIIGTTVTVQDVDKNEVIFSKEIRYGESSYDFYIRSKHLNFERNRTKSVLITGGCGFVGRHFTRRFCEMGWDVTIVDNMISESALPISNWPQHLVPPISCKVSYFPMDCRDFFASSDSRRHFTLFMHLAAVAGDRANIGTIQFLSFKVY